MTTSFDEFARAKIEKRPGTAGIVNLSKVATLNPDETIENQTEVQPIMIGNPCYHWMSTTFFANFVNLTRVGDFPVQITNGVYLPQAMRHIVKTCLTIPGWKRLLIVEQDMILPPDAIVKHALHTDPIVGSLYFQHRPPHHANIMLQNSERKVAHLRAIGIATMIAKPALYKCDVVGMGCTSIRRDVLEDWPTDIPMFRNDFLAEAKDDPFTGGEVSHDVWFCQRAREQGHEIYMDSSIMCEHLTEGAVNDKHYLAAHADELGLDVSVNGGHGGRIVLPNRAERRRVRK